MKPIHSISFLLAPMYTSSMPDQSLSVQLRSLNPIMFSSACKMQQVAIKGNKLTLSVLKVKTPKGSTYTTALTKPLSLWLAAPHAGPLRW